jgi:hypothetical protein
MVSRTGEAETITSHYLFALGIYRFFYILNWIYRYYMENFLDWISIVSGVIQTILYCDFFYLYMTRGRKKKFFCNFINMIFLFSSSWKKYAFTRKYLNKIKTKKTFKNNQFIISATFILNISLNVHLCSSLREEKTI